jgi:hypothetical protein
VTTLFRSLCLLTLLAPAVLADAGESPTDTPAEIAAVADPAIPANPNTGHVSKRLFGILPNYRAADAPDVYTHPTVHDKFKIARQNTFDWPTYFTNAAYALQNQFSQKGTGAFGRNFAEYYARSWGDSIIGNYTTQAVLPSLLGEDPRYFRMGAGSGWKRTWHAVSQVAITKGTNGNNRIHLSELGGNAGVVAVTNMYYPDQGHGLGPSTTRWSFMLMNDAISNLLNEFLPDLARKMQKKK